MSSNRRRISPRRIPRIAPLRKMFSRPVSSRWKPVPTSSRRHAAVDRRASPLVGVRDPREQLQQGRLAGRHFVPITRPPRPARTSNVALRSAPDLAMRDEIAAASPSKGVRERLRHRPYPAVFSPRRYRLPRLSTVTIAAIR